MDRNEAVAYVRDISIKKFRLNPRNEDDKDILQEVTYQVLKKFPETLEPGLVYNRVKWGISNERKKNKKEADFLSYYDDFNLVSGNPEYEVTWEAKFHEAGRKKSVAESLFKHLPEKHKEILFDVFYRRLSPDEICELRGITKKRFYSMKTYAISKLKKLFKRECND